MNGNTTFVCSICAEPSTDLCVYCTHDACPNHLCERCHRCSDCCTCDSRVRIDDRVISAHSRYGEAPATATHSAEPDSNSHKNSNNK